MSNHKDLDFLETADLSYSEDIESKRFIKSKWYGNGVTKSIYSTNKFNDNYILSCSNHPYSPFKGNYFKWLSKLYDDFTMLQFFLF
jgi:hypothetical protein